MGKHLRENYFIIVRIVLMLMFLAYGYAECTDESGVSVGVLLLVALYITLMASKEMAGGVYSLLLFAGAGCALIALCLYGGRGFVPLVYLMVCELLAMLRADYRIYFFVYAAIFIECPADMITRILLATMLLVVYIQHEHVVSEYRRQMMEDTIKEQGLKHDMRVELEKSALQTENKMLAQRAELSQTLHDKLGHNINGSIYQLEASKVLMEKDPEKAKGMIQAVIDQLRTGMDEIRAILRKERPEKKKMALLQLHELCEDCNEKGVAAELVTEGDLAQVPDSIWEVLLDNAYEAVTNAMRYAKCKRIDISINVMNKLVRCTVTDDGIGCTNITDGMGISGMRQRVRAAGGTIDFQSEAGFTVRMILPME